MAVHRQLLFVLSSFAPVLILGQCTALIPVVTFQSDCATGGTLRWNGLFNIGSGSIPSPCPGPFSYSMFNGGTSTSGTLANDWVQESPTLWRYNAPLASGTLAVDIFPTNAAPLAQWPDCLALFNICTFSCPVAAACYAAASVTVPLSPGDCGVNVNVRAWLDGALPSGALMNDGLRASGLIPTTEPYSAMGYTYTGSAPGATIPPSLLAATGNNSGSNAVVDWVIVELRSTPTTVLWSKPVLIRRNGNLMDTDGDSYINFPVAAGNYRLAIKHRNHLGVMTNAAVALSTTPVLIDLGSANTIMYGADARVLKGSTYCLWAGDATGNGIVQYVGNSNDRDPILLAIGGSTPTNTVSNVYSPLDVNMDGQIKYVGNGNDRDPILATVGGSTPTNTRVQQLP